ncbi:MAG: UvrB/UvrC motif-containing protein [Planctomycetota bacterium]
MQYCTACQKAIATVVILECRDGALAGSQHVCQACADQLGVGAPKAPKFTAELLEDLLGQKGARRHGKPSEACPGCGMTPVEFRAKGRLGCPRCYEAFRTELVPLLQRIHEAVAHAGRLPGVSAQAPPPPVDDRSLTEVRRRLEDAVRGERYEEAARLRDELRRLERGQAAPGAS